MSLSKQKGNMYDFITHTWNPIKGKCMHECTYCYMKRWGEQKPIRLDEKCLNDDLGMGNFIFVGSSTDMFAKDVPPKWIGIIINKCYDYPNTYLFQSKNPETMRLYFYPNNTILGTTIETNRDYEVSPNTPNVWERAKSIGSVNYHKTMVTIEPILDFDHDELIQLIQIASPTWVNIGAVTGGHNLPEPSKEKVLKLIDGLSQITTVRNKANLKRILETK